MFRFQIEPRLSETDGLGHINNTVPPVWFEEARKDLLRIMNPEMHLRGWNIILKKYEIEFFHQIYHLDVVDIETYLEKIGKSSLVVRQKAVQSGKLVVTAKTVLIHFDFDAGGPTPIPDDVRGLLEAHVIR
jgi:acyl-CoA thioester hydrolase